MKRAKLLLALFVFGFFLAASVFSIFGARALADPMVPRPFPCGMISTTRGQLRLTTVGASGPYLKSVSTFPVWINSAGGPAGAVCSEVHSISRQNVYEISVLRFRPKGRLPRSQSCGLAQSSFEDAVSFTYHLRPGDWAAVPYEWPKGELGVEAVYVPRPGEYSFDSGISACVKITGKMNETPDQLTGTLDPFGD